MRDHSCLSHCPTLPAWLSLICRDFSKLWYLLSGLGRLQALWGRGKIRGQGLALLVSSGPFPAWNAGRD